MNSNKICDIIDKKVITMYDIRILQQRIKNWHKRKEFLWILNHVKIPIRNISMEPKNNVLKTNDINQNNPKPIKKKGKKKSRWHRNDFKFVSPLEETAKPIIKEA